MDSSWLESFPLHTKLDYFSKFKPTLENDKKRVWIDSPDMNLIKSYIENKSEIPQGYKLVVTHYKPNSEINVDLTKYLEERFIVTTEDDSPDINLGKKSVPIVMRKWNVYHIPSLIKQVNITFTSIPKIKKFGKKGHRSSCSCASCGPGVSTNKNLEERNVLVFDFVKSPDKS